MRAMSPPSEPDATPELWQRNRQGRGAGPECDAGLCGPGYVTFRRHPPPAALLGAGCDAGLPPGRRPVGSDRLFGRELSGVLAFALRGEMIQAVHVIADPAKLS